MKVFIMRGVSGSGKSTIANKITTVANATVVSADHYFKLPKAGGRDRDGGQMPDREYDFNPMELGYAHAYCMRKFIEGLASGVDVIVDNTNTTWAETASYASVASAYRAETVIVNIWADPEDAVSRNVHGVPESAIRSMAANMKEPLPPFAPSGLNVWSDLPCEVFGCLSEVPAAGGMSLGRRVGGVQQVLYDEAPYAGHEDETGAWVYTRQAIVI